MRIRVIRWLIGFAMRCGSRFPLGLERQRSRKRDLVRIVGGGTLRLSEIQGKNVLKADAYI